MVDNTVYVTKEGLTKLEKELDHLINVRRQEVAHRLHEAIEDGELIENAEYEAAKNEQAFVEGRILELERTLSKAKIIEPGESKGVVEVGSTVVVDPDDGPKETYRIVGAAEANPKEGLISNQSPLGQALIGCKVDDDVEVAAPAGALHYRVVKIT